MRMKAYYMPGALPPSIRLVSPQRLCRITGGNFVTTGDGAILQLPGKPSLIMKLGRIVQVTHLAQQQHEATLGPPSTLQFWFAEWSQSI